MIVKASSIVPLFFVLCAVPQIAHAQAADTTPATAKTVAYPDDEAVVHILRNGVDAIDIPLNERDDLSGCDGVDAAGVLHAIRTCWPVLQSYRISSPLGAYVQKWVKLPRKKRARDTSESRDVLATADQIIAAADGRIYPAQDPLLASAYQAKSLVMGARGDYEGFLEGLLSTREIVSTSRISSPGFKKALVYLDGEIARARKMIADSKK